MLDLLPIHLLVVVMVVVVVVMAVPVMLVVMMTMVMMLLVQRCCISAAGADDRQRDGQGKSQAEGRQERLLHDFGSFSVRTAL